MSARLLNLSAARARRHRLRERNGVQEAADSIYEFDGSGWRQCKPHRHVNVGRMSWPWRIIDPVWHHANGAHRRDENSPVERDANELIAVRLADGRIVNDTRFLVWIGQRYDS
jgi:hypothetical protein